MSGRKQHFIPQCLLRRFAASELRKTKSIRVWVHPKERPSYLTATEGVAAQRHFYSDVRDDGVATLDDLITKYESRFASLLRDIERTGTGHAVDSTSAAEVVSHLVIRNAHLRHGVQAVMNEVAQTVVDTFGNKDKLANYLGLHRLTPNRFFDEKLAERAAEMPPEFSSYPEGLVRMMAFATARENIGFLVNDQMTMFLEELSNMSNKMDREVRELHNKTLEINPLEIPHGFVAASPVSDWSLLEPIQPAILPDCAAIGVKTTGQSGPLLFTSGEELRYVILPMGPRNILVGRRLGDDWPSLLDVNEQLAQASTVFFVSHADEPGSIALRASIGASSTAIVSTMMSEAALAMEPNVNEDGPVPAFHFHGRPSVIAGPELETYPVVFQDFDHAFPAKRLADYVGEVIRELGDLLPLNRLAGLIFAHDYEGALKGLDRGFAASEPLSTISAEFGVGLFRTPLILRDGHLKVQVIARAELAYGLLSEDQSIQEYWRYVLVRCLANVGYSCLVEISSPGVLLGRFDEHGDADRFNAVDGVLMCYYSCRLSAPIYAGALDEQIDLLETTVRVASENVALAIQSHWQSCDFGMVGSSVLRHSSLILERLAEVAGTLAGDARIYTEYPRLSKILQDTNLEKWFVTFCRDLEGWWNNQGAWKYPEDVILLELHLDRITWAFSTPFWKDSELGWQVFVPNSQ